MDQDDEKKDAKQKGVFSKQLSCVAPWKKLFIDGTGDITPCIDCRVPVGNIFKDKIENVWNNKKMQVYRWRLINGSCGDWCYIFR